VTDELPPGNPELIRQIARRYLENGASVDPNEIVVIVGATEAINLCLQAVAKPGDIVAVESPTFYAMLHAIERMGMRAIEVARIRANSSIRSRRHRFRSSPLPNTWRTMVMRIIFAACAKCTRSRRT
jgi:DNA-binding transcriptional MocR family regulator